MARCSSTMWSARLTLPLAPPLLLLLLLLLLGCLSAASPSHGRRLICWQAIMNCQAEPECNYAYEHYARACGPVLSGERRRCPSHCISSLVQLNLTRSGPALEDCSCAHDPLCTGAKRAIEPCLPRTTSTGCTEARRQCERDGPCSSAMHDYLKHCGKLFSGAVCTNACRGVIANMRKIPKGQQLDACMCDGTERAICEFVKSSMKALCFESSDRGQVEVDEEDDDEEEEEGSGSDYERRLHYEEGLEKLGMEELQRGASPPAATRCALTLLASILALFALI